MGLGVRLLCPIWGFRYGGLARAISTSFIYPYIRAKVIAQTDPEARKLSPMQILQKA